MTCRLTAVYIRLGIKAFVFNSFNFSNFFNFKNINRKLWQITNVSY